MNRTTTNPVISRRDALIAGAAATIASMVPSRAFAANTFKVGAIDATIFSDGHMTVPVDRLTRNNTDEARKAAGITGETMPFAINVVLLTIGGKRVLIDAGSGGTWMTTAGKLGDALAAANIDTKSIDHVLLTHAHPDHLWGLIDDFDDSIRFPNAKLSIPDTEFQFWMTAGRAEAAGAADGSILGARRVFARIADRLTRSPADSEPFPGLGYVPAPGHTSGQCAVLATSGSDHLLITADTIFHPVVSVAHPDWQPAQDMDGTVAAASRKRMLDIAATKKALVVAYHIATPGAGRIESVGTGYAWRSA